ncbi:hypothetical protein RUM44_010725 [Polyplax serrata]|uniref:Uncharacterized protein n=1 Tax=Polyplax serrata TaxID=468196 RepID=A0ABR1APJ6_POLSC
MKKIFTLKLILLLALNAFSSPSPQGSQHGQPAAGSMSTPVPGTVGSGLRRGRWREWRRGDPTLLNNLWKSKTPLATIGLFLIFKLEFCGSSGYLAWVPFYLCLVNQERRFWCFPGNAEVYIVLALLIGFITVIIGCWLSDNCWSPEPEHVVTIA